MAERQAATTSGMGNPRRGALVLLAALLLGTAVMTFTRGWIGALPQHDHLLLRGESGHRHTHAHHAHEGDDLSLALAELVFVGTPRGALTLEAARVARVGQAAISLAPLTAQSDPSSFGAVGAVLAIVLALALARGARREALAWGAVAGRSLVPLAPPPRVA